MDIPPDLRILATCFVEADGHAFRQQILFRQLKAMARKAGEQWDRLAEFRADCEAELAAAMAPGQEITLGELTLVRVDRDGFPAIEVENALVSQFGKCEVSR